MIIFPTHYVILKLSKHKDNNLCLIILRLIDMPIVFEVKLFTILEHFINNTKCRKIPVCVGIIPGIKGMVNEIYSFSIKYFSKNSSLYR